MQIQMHKMIFKHQELGQAKRLMGFDHEGAIYHLLCFDFGDDGGAIGIWKEGDDFCARISLDDLANFNRQAKAEFIEGHA
jgi:hypothetical protein